MTPPVIVDQTPSVAPSHAITRCPSALRATVGVWFEIEHQSLTAFRLYLPKDEVVGYSIQRSFQLALSDFVNNAQALSVPDEPER